MKKFSIILVITLILAAALCGCGDSTNDPVSDDSTSTPVTEIDISIFPEVETSSENLKIYREEVSSRVEALEKDEGTTFITDEEWEAISSEWDDDLYRHNTYFTSFDSLYEETSEYYFPVVFRDGNSLVMWYTSESGSVLLEKVYGYWNDSNYVGIIHSDSEDELIYSKVDSALTYSKDTGTVTVWEFGKVKETITGIPQDSVYCGFSRFEGYIFRSGTDVYSLDVNTWDADGTVSCIAHNVNYVIDADYYYGSDPWCQPLFIMTDGSIKAYIGWEGDQDTPDSPSHLCDLQYEGSWDK